MAKEKKICSILELPLITEPWQKTVLNKKMECVRKIYNSMLSVQLKKYHEMTKTQEWRSLNDIIREELKKADASGIKKNSKELQAAYDRKNAIMREWGFSDFDFRLLAIEHSKYYQKHVSSNMAVIGVGMSMWSAFEKLFFGNGEKVSFKKFGTVSSLVSNGKSGIRFIQEDDGRYSVVLSNRMAKSKPITLYIKGPNTMYDREMLNANIKMVRVVRKIEKGHENFYVQLTGDRSPFEKIDSEGNLKHPLGSGLVGICIFRGMLCAVSDTETYSVNLIPDEETYTAKKVELSRELEHLRRVNNPNNYNEDGTIKKGIIEEDGKRHRLVWVETNHYKKVKAQLKELHRKHTAKKNLLQNEVVNHLLSMGDSFKMMDVSFLTTKPEWDEENPLPNSEYKKKKARRRSIQEAAPSMLLSKLDRKLNGKLLEPIKRIELPETLYWYQHDKGVSDKDLFAGSNIMVAGKVISHTMYRAFLIRHFDEKLKVYDQKALSEEWNKRD